MSQTPENGAPHRIDIEQAWDEFTRMNALVDEKDADDFLAVMYAWRDEAVADATRVIPPGSGDAESDQDRILQVLTEHVGTATTFCRACGPDLRPAPEELDDWDTVGIRRHQSEKIAAALTKVYKPHGYTEADQRADTSFLVGVRYGRESERARILAEET